MLTVAPSPSPSPSLFLFAPAAPATSKLTTTPQTRSSLALSAPAAPSFILCTTLDSSEAAPPEPTPPAPSPPRTADVDADAPPAGTTTSTRRPGCKKGSATLGAVTMRRSSADVATRWRRVSRYREHDSSSSICGVRGRRTTLDKKLVSILQEVGGLALEEGAWAGRNVRGGQSQRMVRVAAGDASLGWG